MGERTGGLLKRRGLLAGAAALLAGGVAKLAGPDRIEAGHTSLSTPEPLHIGVINDGTSASNSETQTSIGSQTILVARTNANSSAAFRVRQLGAVPRDEIFHNRAIQAIGASTSSAAILAGDGLHVTAGDHTGGGSGGRAIVASAGEARGSGRGGDAVWLFGGTSLDGNAGAGVFTRGGFSNLRAGPGVEAEGGNGGSSGIAGDGAVISAGDGLTGGVGVRATGGRSGTGRPGGIGVLGQGGPTSGGGTATAAGVQGTSGSGIGVRGDATTGSGVFGGSDSGIGVYADSKTSTSVFSTSTRTAVWGRSAAGTGVFGHATGTGASAGFGMYGAANAPGWAGYFEGNVYVTGRVTQAGAAASTATATDGSMRAVYSVDSAEPVIEDFGEGKLAHGRSEVKLDPNFAAIAAGGAYQVFLTPEGDSKGLYVTDKGPGGFTVREQQNGTASLAFAYRVVAKQKGVSGKRLERIERPKGLDAKDLEPPKLPDLPKVKSDKPTAGPEDRPGRPNGR